MKCKNKKAKKKTICFRLPEELYKDVSKFADKHDITVTQVVRSAILYALKGI